MIEHEIYLVRSYDDSIWGAYATKADADAACVALNKEHQHGDTGGYREYVDTTTLYGDFIDPIEETL